MGNLVGIVLTCLILAGFVVGYATLAKFTAFRAHTRDGDSFGNRLMGHGPDDEVQYRRFGSREDDSTQHYRVWGDDDDLPKAG